MNITVQHIRELQILRSWSPGQAFFLARTKLYDSYENITMLYDSFFFNLLSGLIKAKVIQSNSSVNHNL